MSEKLPDTPLTEEEIFDVKYDITNENTITKRFIILSLQRTGSTYITRRLCNVLDEFGMPGEYFHENAIKTLLPRLVPIDKTVPDSEKKVSIESYIKAIEKVRTTGDGLFGMKVQPHQLANIFKSRRDLILKFIESFDQIIIMTRKNKFAQAVSTSISAISNEWHPGKKEIDFDAAKKRRAYELTAKNIYRHMQEEAFLLSFAKNSKKPILHIEYEDMEASPDIIFEKTIKFISQDESKKIETEDKLFEVPTKNSNSLSKEIEKNFIKFISGSLKL